MDSKADIREFLVCPAEPGSSSAGAPDLLASWSAAPSPASDTAVGH
ncbi:MAG TPA: hypothetical protein VMU63_10205 [Acidimicrobiales bacterium]|nr:hypothetical protein [Acidimicrobiales bacterium]